MGVRRQSYGGSPPVLWQFAANQLLLSHSIPVILLCHLYKAQNYCWKCCIYTVCCLCNCYYFLLPYYNSIVTTPVHCNSRFPLHTIKLVYCNNHPHKHKLIYTKNILLTNTLLLFKILILIIWAPTC